MQVKFWGTRGSIPVPGESTARYGGNTSCVEVRSAAGTTVIIDCGTGLRVLGQEWVSAKEKPKHAYILLSHTHWDHIQGLPFFLPLFMSGYEWDVYGPKGLSCSIKDTLSGQMQYSYFPVGMGHFTAVVRYHDLLEGVFYLNDIKVTVRYLNHTSLTCGFRLEADGCTVVYDCDHEPYGVEAAYGDNPLTEQDKEHAEFAKGADLLIHDAQYSEEEYAKKIGWGHSTAEYVCKIAQYAGAKKVALTHHEPARSDEAIEAHVRTIIDRFSPKMPEIEIFAAMEGQTIDLKSRDGQPASHHGKEISSATNTAAISVAHEQSILVYAADPNIVALFTNGARANNVLVAVVDTIQAIEEQIKSKKIALLIIEHNPPQQDAVNIVKLLQQTLGAEANSTPIVVVSAHKETLLTSREGISEYLTLPLSPAYVQTRILAWLLRISCRWQPAPFPENEKARLSALHGLNILDTEQEERFDRITRLATALFRVPVAMISLVDMDRQWFKSAQGIAVKETPRDISFCSHAVYENKTLVINDTTLDNRFADNHLVVAEPHVRFYAGAPLILKEGYCVGALCIADTRPRIFNANEVKALEDMRDMVVEELSHGKG
ncbi:MAG: metal-dependent hydrolase, beta-lactamase superfamily [Gammaproteobacteria bacterium]|jgi:phosphoribosyl 1,2-cyclic phosphodiesterase/DNA-binding response OmpR family regulator|nr:metal-dependent hydrolase, beta-lactamase superfamily [Gammaproteobacteria bacterium]